LLAGWLTVMSAPNRFVLAAIGAEAGQPPLDLFVVPVFRDHSRQRP